MAAEDFFPGFSNEYVSISPDCRLFTRRKDGRAKGTVLLLHGYPQTHLIWRHIGPQLACSSLSHGTGLSRHY